jgi:TolB-like protein/class 3 adenylate cyclase/Tfp pilus assembly protein PilF
VANETDVQRRLVAVFAADVEGYSRLMGADEVGTLKGLTERRAILDKAIADHRGRIANTAGDSVLAEFGSAVDAVHCAVEAQAALMEANANLSPDRRINFRIGIHVGDVMVRAGDLFGDGVNIAARLQTLAEPGGVCVSGETYGQVRKVLPVAFTDLGTQRVKNIEEPITTYAIAAVGPVQTSAVSKPGRMLLLPDKPSIAVLPFSNMSGDPEQEYFADGMVEDIITGLSINKSLFVIARNSSFAYKGKSPDIRQVGRELGVRYVLEGSVRKSGNRVRITGQLIDATSGAHLWAERFDGDLEDIFDLQDQLASRVIGGIAPSLERAEIERVKKKTDNLQAYDYYLRCKAEWYRATPEGNREALEFARRAVAIDPDFALGHATIAILHNVALSFGWMVNVQKDCEEAERAIRRALELDRNDATVLAFCGQTLIFTLRQLEEGASLLDRAVTINPNLATALTNRAASRIALDQPDEAIANLERSLRLGPLDARKFYALTLLARAHNLRGTPQEGLPYAAEALRLRPNFPSVPVDAAVAHVLTGDIQTGRQLVGMIRKVYPSLTLTSSMWGLFAQMMPRRGIEIYAEALRAAGFPE